MKVSTSNTHRYIWLVLTVLISLVMVGVALAATSSAGMSIAVMQDRLHKVGETTDTNGSTWWSLTKINSPPEAFSKIAPLNGANMVPITTTLSWESSIGATSYEYCIREMSLPCLNWVSIGMSTSVIPTGLGHLKFYYWQVRAINDDGATDANGGNPWNFFTTYPPPYPFSKISPTDGELGVSTSPHLSWNPTSGDPMGGTISYQYCYDTNDDDACSATWTSTGANSWVDPSGLSYATTYFWQVRAAYTYGTTYADGGTWFSFTTSIKPPVAFSKIAPANGATMVPVNTILSWESSSGATSYDYCYDISSACMGWHSAGTNTNVELSGLTKGVTYYWQVKAVNNGGSTYANGNGDSTWSFTTRGIYRILVPLVSK